MPSRNIVIGQIVNPEKIARAKELRRELTPEEKVIWERLRANRFHGLRFRRQQVIDGYIADFYCHAVAVVIEIDGPVHDEQADRDLIRDKAFQARGLNVLRITNDEIHDDIEAVMARIAVTCGKA